MSLGTSELTDLSSLCLSTQGPRGERGPRGITGKPGPKVCSWYLPIVEIGRGWSVIFMCNDFLDYH